MDLLPSGHGRSRLKGDAPEMVGARVRVLERGVFAPVAEHLGRRAADLAAEKGGALAVLDVGCGVGYHLGEVARALASAAPDAPHTLLGLDVSKDAVRAAARRVRDALFFINDIKHRITVADGAIDLLLVVFAPRNAAEFARVLAPGGRLLIVIPTERHLAELRGRIPLLAIPREKRHHLEEQLEGVFALRSAHPLEHEVELEGPELSDLVRMTPNRWHLDEDALAAVAAWDPARITLSVEVLEFEPTLDHRPASG